MAAPVVVAKGHGLVADEIVRRGGEHGIAIHVSDNLAAMLMQVELDRAIPPQLFHAVAQLLAWLYLLEARAAPVANAPLPSSHVSDADPAFALRHPADIIEILDQLCREEIPVTVEFENGPAIVSSVLEVRRDTNAMVFDVARDADCQSTTLRGVVARVRQRDRPHRHPVRDARAGAGRIRRRARRHRGAATLGHASAAA